MSADRLHKERRAAPDECETLVRGSAYRAAAREKPRTPASVRRPPTSGAHTTRRDRTSLDPPVSTSEFTPLPGAISHSRRRYNVLFAVFEELRPDGESHPA